MAEAKPDHLPIDAEINVCTPEDDERMRNFPVSSPWKTKIVRDLEGILDGGLQVHFGANDFIKNSKNYDDFDKYFPKGVPRLLKLLILAAQAECRAGQRDACGKDLMICWRTQEGLIETPSVALAILAGIKGRREFVQVVIYCLPLLGRETLTALSDSLKNRADVSQSMLNSMIFNMIGTVRLIENSMPFSRRGYFSAFIDEPTRFWALFKLNRRLQTQRYIFMDRMMAMMDAAKTNFATEEESKILPPSLYFNEQTRKNYQWNFEENLANEALIVTLIQAIDAELEQRRAGSKTTLEIPIDEYRKIVIGRDHGCVDPPL